MEYELSKLGEGIRDAARLFESLPREDSFHDGKAGSYSIFRPG
jgi:hypothetical protein